MVSQSDFTEFKSICSALALLLHEAVGTLPLSSLHPPCASGDSASFNYEISFI